MYRHPESVSSSEASGEEKRRRLLRCFDGNFPPLVDCPLLFAGRGLAVFVLLDRERIPLSRPSHFVRGSGESADETQESCKGLACVIENSVSRSGL